MREAIRGVGFALMIATALHSIATGNLLPAWVKVVCVDINPATVTKLSDRGTFQTSASSPTSSRSSRTPRAGDCSASSDLDPNRREDVDGSMVMDRPGS